MSEPSADSSTSAPTPEAIGCPPPAERVPDAPSDPRAELLQLAATLARTRSHRLLIEYLRLRRAVR
jgi:hypothetical protein